MDGLRSTTPDSNFANPRNFQRRKKHPKRPFGGQMKAVTMFRLADRQSSKPEAVPCFARLDSLRGRIRRDSAPHPHRSEERRVGRERGCRWDEDAWDKKVDG